jgi:hypothetical protein
MIVGFVGQTSRSARVLQDPLLLVHHNVKTICPPL